MRRARLSLVRISGEFFVWAESHIGILSRSEKSLEIRPGPKNPWAKIHVTRWNSSIPLVV